jgi:hypothetical protein
MFFRNIENFNENNKIIINYPVRWHRVGYQVARVEASGNRI